MEKGVGWRPAPKVGGPLSDHPRNLFFIFHFSLWNFIHMHLNNKCHFGAKKIPLRTHPTVQFTRENAPYYNMKFHNKLQPLTAKFGVQFY